MIWVGTTSSLDPAFEFHAIRRFITIKFFDPYRNIRLRGIPESGQIIYLVLVALEAEASHIVHCNYMVDFASDASRIAVKTNSVSTMAVVYPIVSMSGGMLSTYWGLEC